jgi:hypothetical protein
MYKSNLTGNPFANESKLWVYAPPVISNAADENAGPKINIDADEDEVLPANDPENDLDVPGADLDDDLEAIGEEDEENNYYSIGGEEHNDLEEDPSGPGETG